MPIDEQAFQAGKIAGDIISVVIGAVSTIEGLATIYSSINIAAGGALVTATGVGAAPGGVVVAVSGVGVVVGTAELGAGIALITGGLGNFSNDVSNYSEANINAKNQEAISNWNKGSFDSKDASLEYHFERHGKEVGANSKEQYARKAYEFSKTAKKGSTKSYVDGYVDGTIRYKKNGKYIDIAPDGTIVSFGKQ